MQIKDPIKLRLRETTHSAIEHLVCTGRYNQKEACMKIFNLAKSKHQPTGFSMKEFSAFYGMYRKYRSLFKKEQQKTTAKNVTNYEY